jgi:hypothetical protein
VLVALCAAVSPPWSFPLFLRFRSSSSEGTRMRVLAKTMAKNFDGMETWEFFFGLSSFFDDGGRRRVLRVDSKMGSGDSHHSRVSSHQRSNYLVVAFELS